VESLPELFVHLVVFGALFWRQSLIELRRSPGADRYELS
jgi:hypothetical protein